MRHLLDLISFSLQCVALALMDQPCKVDKRLASMVAHPLDVAIVMSHL